MSAAALRPEGGGCAGDSTPGSDTGERITRLFPKCRPKTAMQHHHDRLNSGLENRNNDMNNKSNVSSDEERRDDQVVILNSKSGSYKLRDSRIIEIAGGRELYSQSRMKAVRKLRHSSNTHKHNLRNKARTTRDTIEFNHDTYKTEIPMQRLANNDISKKMVSKQTSPTFTNGQTRLDQNNFSQREPSPILNEGQKTLDMNQKGSPIAVVADGEVVVFDDISEDWKGLRLDNETSDVDLDVIKRTVNGSELNMNKSMELTCEGSESTPSETRLSDASPGRAWSGDDEKGRVRVIGELPIAEYEGSPRRYGVGPQIRTTRSPRPGFPQRVVTESRDVSPPSGSTAFDYLYEFSETRKVLEEFFRCPAGQTQLPAGAAEEIVNFQELDYVVRRQRGAACEDGVDEEPWTGNDALESPRAHQNHTNFLGLQVRNQSERYPDPNIAELCVGAAWSGSGSPTGRPRPQYTLSPETSSCDSRCDLDSDLSLMLAENEQPDLKGLTESRTGVGTVSMPVVEDGLSSGHASDTDNNNQLPSPQTHTSVIIEEIVENGTSSETHVLTDADLHSLDPLAACVEVSPPPPAPAPHRPPDEPPPHPPHPPIDPLYAPRKRPRSADSAESVEVKNNSADEEEADTDLETDRLLGQQRTDDQGFFDDKGWRKPKSRTVMPTGTGGVTRSPPNSVDPADPRDDESTHTTKEKDAKKKGKNKEAHAPAVLIEGVLFRARYLGSTQLACEGQPTKATRMLQAEEAVSRIKAPEGENQPSTEVDLFISTEKIMVLNTELKEIMMDHALRTISYIADIGDLVVLMAGRRFVPHDTDSDPPKLNRTPKMICHVFESEEAQFIAQSIGQAFQVAYMEFLKANGIEDHSFVKEMDYQEVLNSQEIFGDELQMFAKKELQKEVVVPKTKGEILGVVVVESGWGSMLPTVVIANLAPAGAAARCGQLNIGDQIIAINGVSLVGLPLSTCQTYIKNSKNQTVVKLTVVPCPPVVEVKIKRPDTKYQLGFSVQNGVICSLLRGGIAERGGVRVGHRIIEINSQSVVAVPHERIVNLLATSVGEILMKTMPTSMFRLLTGQENPIFI